MYRGQGHYKRGRKLGIKEVLCQINHADSFEIMKNDCSLGPSGSNVGLNMTFISLVYFYWTLNLTHLQQRSTSLSDQRFSSVPTVRVLSAWLSLLLRSALHPLYSLSLLNERRPAYIKFTLRKRRTHELSQSHIACKLLLLFYSSGPISPWPSFFFQQDASVTYGSLCY